jgi:SAM-dependent methyltransferase
MREVDIHRPSAARMYDFYLGGSHNFAADRDAAAEVIKTIPHARKIARANRAFLYRAVGHLVDAGIRQFLDIGSGIPTVGNVHEVAQRSAPDTRVVYVDIDPVAVAQSVELLRNNDRATAIRADLRYPDAILGHSGLRDILDLSQPVGLLLVSMLHFVPDEDAYRAVATLRDSLAPGSHLVISQTAKEGIPSTLTDITSEVYSRSTSPDAAIRTAEEISRFFGDFEMVDPGLVWVSQWRNAADADPDERPEDIAIMAGVGRKPGA